MTGLPTVSVVIPTRNRPLLLEQVLAPVCADPAATEVVVVLDATDAATAAVVAAAAGRHGNVRTVPAPPSEKGLERGQRARDAGVRAASGTVVLALDDDVVVHPGVVTGHARRHAEQTGAVIVGYMPVTPPPHRRTGRGAAKLYSDGYEDAIARYESDPDSILDALWGGNLSLSRASWLEALEEPPVAGGYHGDLALGLRLRDQGLSGRFDRSLRADHHYRREVEQIVDDARSAAIGLSRIRVAHPGRYGPAAFLPRPRFQGLMGIAGRVVRDDARWNRVVRASAVCARVSSLVGLHYAEYLIVRLIRRLAFDRAWHSAGNPPGSR